MKMNRLKRDVYVSENIQSLDHLKIVGQTTPRSACSICQQKSTLQNLFGQENLKYYEYMGRAADFYEVLSSNNLSHYLSPLITHHYLPPNVSPSILLIGSENPSNSILIPLARTPPFTDGSHEVPIICQGTRALNFGTTPNHTCLKLKLALSSILTFRHQETCNSNHSTVFTIERVGVHISQIFMPTYQYSIKCPHIRLSAHIFNFNKTYPHFTPGV